MICIQAVEGLEVVCFVSDSRLRQAGVSVAGVTDVISKATKSLYGEGLQDGQFLKGCRPLEFIPPQLC